jgi:hypothetical protein
MMQQHIRPNKLNNRPSPATYALRQSGVLLVLEVSHEGNKGGGNAASQETDM